MVNVFYTQLPDWIYVKCWIFSNWCTRENWVKGHRDTPCSTFSLEIMPPCIPKLCVRLRDANTWTFYFSRCEAKKNALFWYSNYNSYSYSQHNYVKPMPTIQRRMIHRIFVWNSIQLSAHLLKIEFIFNSVNTTVSFLDNNSIVVMNKVYIRKNCITRSCFANKWG